VTVTTKWNLKRHQATICNVSEEPPSKRARVKTTARVKQPAAKGVPIANPAQPGPSGMAATDQPGPSGMQTTAQVVGRSTTDQPGPSGMQ
ncbi:unnamed protein product, partial [Callosobruchus maculatus]